jgi:hypothetical protein
LEHLYRQPWLGASWEGFVLEQTLAILEAGGRRVQPFFFRTSDGYELDLVLDRADGLWAVETKVTSNPSPDAVDRLRRTAALIGADRCILVCRIARKIESEGLLVIGLPAWLRMLS